jgi:hypothetical protein
MREPHDVPGKPVFDARVGSLSVTTDDENAMMFFWLYVELPYERRARQLRVVIHSSEMSFVIKDVITSFTAPSEDEELLVR